MIFLNPIHMGSARSAVFAPMFVSYPHFHQGHSFPLARAASLHVVGVSVRFVLRPATCARCISRSSCGEPRASKHATAHEPSL